MIVQTKNFNVGIRSCSLQLQWDYSCNKMMVTIYTIVVIDDIFINFVDILYLPEYKTTHFPIHNLQFFRKVPI